MNVDFYSINGKPYFWEMTFYHGAWYEKFTPKEQDYKFWEWIKTQKNNKIYTSWDIRHD